MRWLLLPITFLLFSTCLNSAPDWWARRDILLPSISADDYAVINQGQLKNLARIAAEEMNLHLPGGAGAAINDLIESWQDISTADDYAAVNLGQLRVIMDLFHARLLASGIQLPTASPFDSTSNYTLANSGQAKQAFSFEIPLMESPPSDPSAEDGGGGGGQASPVSGSTSVLLLDAEDSNLIALSAHDRSRFGLTGNLSAASGQILVPDKAGRLIEVGRFPADATAALQALTLDAESNLTVVNNP